MYNIYLHNADKPLGNCAETPQKTTAPADQHRNNWDKQLAS
jgi:hypothetical protein